MVKDVLNNAILGDSDAEFVRNFEKKVEQTIKKYNLASKKDKLLVAVSGGKDSTVLLYVLQKLGYSLEAITVDALIGNYTKENLANLKVFCAEFKVKLKVVSFRKEFGNRLCYLKSVLNSKGFNLKSCTICGVLRRYLLNKNAKELKADKLVTGHNQDDEAQSVLMNFFRNNMSLAARLGPLTGIVESKSFVPRIKPFYLISEKEVIRYSKTKKFKVYYGECPCCVDAYRNAMRTKMNVLEETDSHVKKNVIQSFLSILPMLKFSYRKNSVVEGEIKLCRECGEPSQTGLCQTCKILNALRS